MRLQAIIFDVDGTLAETEETHRTAFNRAFAEAGLDWYWTEADYRALLTTTGGRERIARYMTECGVKPDAGRIAALHESKNGIYGELVAAGAVVPRPGVVALIREARRQSIAIAIATTTSRDNLTALLAQVFGARSCAWFAVMVTGEDVARKKPDPEAYRLALAKLRLDPGVCVAIEDSRNGLDAARAAGIATVVTPSRYMADDDFRDAALVVPDLARFADIAGFEALLAGLESGPVPVIEPCTR